MTELTSLSYEQLYELQGDVSKELSRRRREAKARLQVGMKVKLGLDKLVIRNKTGIPDGSEGVVKKKGRKYAQVEFWEGYIVKVPFRCLEPIEAKKEP